MQEKSILLLLYTLNIRLLPGLCPEPDGELTTLPHTPLLTEEGDPPQIPPNSVPSVPRFPRSAEGASILSPTCLTMIMPLDTHTHTYGPTNTHMDIYIYMHAQAHIHAYTLIHITK